jgi:hypothetical protein
MTRKGYPNKRYCKRLEKAGLYVREVDEPTDLGWFLMNLDYHLHLFRKAINKLSEEG